jgi:hypothetical protein
MTIQKSSTAFCYTMKKSAFSSIEWPIFHLDCVVGFSVDISKESVELFLLRQDNIMPVIVRIPVSSKSIFFLFFTRVVSNLIPISGVVTKITLEKATSRGGQPYAKYCFEAVSTLSPEEISGLKSFSGKIMEVLTVENNHVLKEVV